MIVKYKIPDNWIKYDFNKIFNELIDAKSSVMSLTNVKYQKSWVEDLRKLELKREIAGTSRIEGADFTDNELEDVLDDKHNQFLTRSQRQAHSALNTYRWIETLPNDTPLTRDLIFEFHRKIILGADDDHCAPGKLRDQDQNVNFGRPKHRGAEGGKECESAFYKFIDALNHEYKSHDPLIQSLAAHYHFAAIHPFNDGNGRVGRALESLLLQRAGLKLTFFISMSNYYNEEKEEYLNSLNSVRQIDYDLSQFLRFGLKGISLQCQRLLKEINFQISKALFRNVMFHLFGKLKTPHKRVIAERQLEILKILLEKNEISWNDLIEETKQHYISLKFGLRALVRDVNDLGTLGTLVVNKTENNEYLISIRLQWPTEITETSFFEKIKFLPTAKTHTFSM